MIYVWHTGHPINEEVSYALHAGIPQNLLKHTEWIDNYFSSPNKYTAVGYGILRGTGEVFHHNQIRNIDFYEVDRGYINPKHYDGYYRISKNGMQARYREVDLPSDRLEKLRFERAEWFNPKGRVIVCPPSSYIEHFYNHTPGKWESEVVKVLENSGRPFKVRNKDDTTPLNHDLQDASCVVTFNSNVAVDAVIKGIPVITSGESVVWKWSSKWCANTLTSIVDGTLTAPKSEHVDKLLRFISYNQFTLEEIRSGYAWRILHT